jgi:hypothetical protein
VGVSRADCRSTARVSKPKGVSARFRFEELAAGTTDAPAEVVRAGLLLLLVGTGCQAEVSATSCKVRCSAEGECPASMTCGADDYCHGQGDPDDCRPDAAPASPPEPDAPPLLFPDAPPDAVAFDARPPCVAGDVNGVNPTNGHCYMLFEAETTWTTARLRCQDLDAHLITVSDAAENAFVFATVVGGRQVHLGATDASQEGVWTWITAEPFDYWFWHIGEPNDSSGVEECAELATDGDVHAWNDIPCTFFRSYACEREY